MPRGGPNGGDGGKGGDVYFEATSELHSLLDLQYHAHWKGNRGAHGQGSNKHGRNGDDITVPIPRGTLVCDRETGAPLADLTEEGERFLAARGGHGGRGNARFATSTNRAPRFAENGEPGEDREYLLELKLIADVGLVGLPNAGKSTLLAAVSAAHPKIADYPFTTLSPNLGIVQLPDHRSFSMADIPGIIEGASEGKGLGHDFLRHIERTRVLLFLIDAGDPDPTATRETLERELAQHSPEFARRPHLYVLNKLDITENRERAPQIARELGARHCISAATGEEVSNLTQTLWTLVERARREEESAVAWVAPEREYTYEPPFRIQKSAGQFEVVGERAARAVRMTDFENPEAVQHLQETLSRMGLFKALKRAGARPGDTILVGGFEMEYQPD